jgi:hypothetical protein
MFLLVVAVQAGTIKMHTVRPLKFDNCPVLIISSNADTSGMILHASGRLLSGREVAAKRDRDIDMTNYGILALLKDKTL